MNKKALVEKVARVTCARTEARDAVEEFMNAVREALKNGERVTLSDFGTFQVKFQKARRGRNPKTGETIDIPPRKVVKFTPSPGLNAEL